MLLMDCMLFGFVAVEHTQQKQSDDETVMRLRAFKLQAANSGWPFLPRHERTTLHATPL
ncbi:hypothetical protein QA645_40045 [Bradyrhizobium sp. CIAT3101]|uniref:hypothetical protein n=1 Tax=Bradyrhizobium sp. CIAT3101 TaxID=439387 RepID=UPI0024B1CF1E|nr:hypothetical protein [Bradyrhizobium sp. CIAT3101]WFU80574.1 hypothetical protein QA645_40045 [Bradyrhizobium sp. CIAT3101]